MILRTVKQIDNWQVDLQIIDSIDLLQGSHIWHITDVEM